MSVDQSLRHLVCARLTVAAEEILALFDQTIVKYEEELGRSRQDNQEKQQLLESVLSPMIPLVRVSAQIPSPCPPEPSMREEHTEPLQIIKSEPEEQSIKLEEDFPSPESTDVCMKSEEPSLLQQETEPQDKTQEENFSPVPECEEQTEKSLNTYFDNEKDWVCPLSLVGCSETEEDGRHFKQAQKRGKKSASKSSAENYVVNGVAEHQTYQGITGSEDEGTESNEHQCPVCKRKCESEIDLQIHSRVHAVERHYSCSICMKTFGRKSSLILHRKIHTSEKTFSGTVCNKTFRLDKHTRLLTKCNLYSCTVCNKTFTQKSGLDGHKRMHTGENPFSCTVCKKTFSRKNNLIRHEKIHTGEKPYSCAVCNKAFSRRNSLNEHERTHTGEKPFSCTICQITFIQRSHLNQHQKTHTGEKPFKCNICNKAFTRQNSLHEHDRIHTGEKPFVCTVCNKAFRRRNSLNEHERIHNT